MYQVTQPFDIDFVFSRFRAAVLAAPVGGILPGKASSTEQNLPALLNERRGLGLSLARTSSCPEGSWFHGAGR